MRGTAPIVTIYNAIANGQSNPAGAQFATLAAAQAEFACCAALTDEIDFLVLQTVINSGAPVTLPPGTYVLNRTLTAGASGLYLTGSGRDVTVLQFDAGVAGVQFGSAAAPSGQILRISNLTFTTLGGGNVVGLQTWMSSATADRLYVWQMSDVYFRGGWQNAVVGSNMQRGLTFRNVVAYGDDDTVMPQPAFVFGATTGSFDYLLENCMAVAYAFAFQFNQPNAAQGGIEGVTLRSCKAFGGYGLVQILNPSPTYVPPAWRIEDSDVQGYGPFIQAQRVSNLTIDGGIYIMVPGSGGFAGQKSPAGEVDLIDLEGCTEATLRGIALWDMPGCAGYSFVRADGACSAVEVTGCQFRGDNGSPNSAVRIEANAAQNVVYEHDNVWRRWNATAPAVNDMGGNQVSQKAMDELGVTVTSGGIISLHAVTGGITTAPNGRFTVMFPTRPVTGKPLFGAAPVVMNVSENSFATIPTPTIIQVLETGFVGEVPTTIPLILQVSYSAVGR